MYMVDNYRIIIMAHEQKNDDWFKNLKNSLFTNLANVTKYMHVINSNSCGLGNWVSLTFSRID